MARRAKLVLIGFSGTGKSTVARLVAARLGRPLVDTDAAVEARLGMAVPEVFARHGEATFREAERAALVGALARDEVVVATGGGAVVDPEVWGRDLLGRADVLVVALDAAPATILHRLAAQQADEGAPSTRPLLVGTDPLGRIAALKARRQDAYGRAGIVLAVDRLAASSVADVVTELLDGDPGSAELSLEAPSGRSAIHVARGGLARLGALARARYPRGRRAWLVTDARVGPLHAPAARSALSAVGFEVRERAVPVGEGSKSLAGAGGLYDWLLGGGVERDDLVVALGGGVVGDLAGFVAATCLRGVGLVQVPTSLVAMVDSSVGGKTGINHAAGKNLIGAFYQPAVVVIDPTLLATLPVRELTSGWGEVTKHAVIQPSTPGGERGDLFGLLERNARALRSLEEPLTGYIIRRNVALKAAVVAEDEREAGSRAVLNFGHTLGHAIEAAGYRYLHGEAIALGMRAAGRLGALMGTCDEAWVARLDGLLDGYGLPGRAEVEPSAVLALLGSDKKRSAGRQRWVLPCQGGGVVVRDDVPEDRVAAALDAVRGR